MERFRFGLVAAWWSAWYRSVSMTADWYLKKLESWLTSVEFNDSSRENWCWSCCSRLKILSLGLSRLNKVSGTDCCLSSALSSVMSEVSGGGGPSSKSSDSASLVSVAGSSVSSVGASASMAAANASSSESESGLVGESELVTSGCIVAAMMSSRVVVSVISIGGGDLAGDANKKSRKSAIVAVVMLLL